MELFVGLVLTGIVMILPGLAYERWARGKGRHSMGMGKGEINFGRNLGATHWREINDSPEDRHSR